MRSAGWPSSSASSARTSIATGGEPAARALSRMLRKTCSRRNGSAGAAQVDAVDRLAQDGLLVLAGRLEVGPGLAPDRAQVARGLLELDRGRVAADVLVEVMEVVLGLLEPVDQVERLGPVADGQGEHLEAGLAALQGVAALVGQPGDHLRRWRPAARPGGPAPGPA